jgi:hypothetical protein
MNRPLVVVLVAFAWLGSGHAYAESVLIAGSGSDVPPEFHGFEHVQITPVIDRALPFTVPADSDYRVDEIQVAIYRPATSGATTAQFSIHADESGVPGAKLATFDVVGIPLMMIEVLTAAATDDVVLDAGAPYWLVGTTEDGQANWSLAAGPPPLGFAFGASAFNLRDEGWVVTATGNIGTYAILGTPVPEPSAALTGLIAVLMVCGEGRTRARKSWGTRI